jgi:hypothetical protein
MESIISFFIFFEQIKSEIWNQYREIIVSILCIFLWNLEPDYYIVLKKTSHVT